MRTLFARLAFMVGLLTSGQAAAAELLMFTTDGCFYCEKWAEEVSPAYLNSTEQRFAPLRYVELYGQRPSQYKFVRGVAHTPTFVVVHDGKEYGRLVGYTSDHFFWPQLQKILMRLPKDARRLN